MKWIPGYKTELLPPIDNADYPKQYVVRIKGDDPHSGWIYINHETAEKMRDINEDGYWEWLDESPTTADASVLKEALEKIRDHLLGPWQTFDEIEEIVKEALARHSTQSPSSIEESGLKEGEEKTRRDIAKIMEDNIDFHPQVNGFVVHGAIDKIIQYFKKP